jgi:outer membrane murein-binding lipoprotein Lpp
MTRTQTLLALLAVVVAAWGCGKTPTGQPAANNNKSLEARVAKLETDLKAAQAQAADLDAKFRAEQARGQAVEKERDALRADLKSRTTERDTLQAQFDGFRKNLKDLIGQAEAAQGLPAVPAVPTGSAAPTTAVNALPAPKGL